MSGCARGHQPRKRGWRVDVGRAVRLGRLEHRAEQPVRARQRPHRGDQLVAHPRRDEAREPRPRRRARRARRSARRRARAPRGRAAAAPARPRARRRSRARRRRASGTRWSRGSRASRPTVRGARPRASPRADARPSPPARPSAGHPQRRRAGRRPSLQRSRSSARNGARTPGSRSFHTSQRGAPRAGRVEDPVDRPPRRLVRALHRRQVGVRAHEVRGEEQVRDRASTASGRSAHEPAVLTSSGSRFVAAVGFGNSIAGSRNHASDVRLVERAVVDVVGELAPDLRRGSPPRVHAIATLPVRRPGRSHSETSTERIPSTRPSPRCSRSTSGQNCACEIAVSAHSESMKIAWPCCERHVAVEVEHHAVHPAHDEPRQRGEPRLGGAQLGREQQPQPLDRQRGDVVVGVHLLGPAASAR